MMGLQIAGIEVVLKMLMYYLHERIWHLSTFGLEPIEKLNEQECV